MTTDPPAHWVTISPTTGPAGGSQWLAQCRCGWVSVTVLPHLADREALDHVAAATTSATNASITSA